MNRRPTPAGRRVLQYMHATGGQISRYDNTASVFGLDGPQFRRVIRGLLERGLIKDYEYGVELTEAGRDELSGAATRRRRRGLHCGERNPNSRLAEDQVRDIRRARASGESEVSVASRFGVSRSSIFNIVKRKSWTHVK